MSVFQQFQPVNFTLETTRQLKPTVKVTLTSMFRTVDLSSGRKLAVVSQDRGFGIYTEVKLENSRHSWSYLDQEINRSIYTNNDRAKRVKERARLGVMKVICAEYNLPFSPWGILVGVRPTKMIHRFIDRQFSDADLKQLLTDVYQVSSSRQELLMDVVKGQRSFFHDTVNNPISIYVGIPFCPTRCNYCSFAAYPLATHDHLIADFLASLEQEIIAIGNLTGEHGLQVESVYVGGGTPTSIRNHELEKLLSLLNQHLNAANASEYTIEAGRPETLTEANLKIMGDHGVRRLSINPQTMHDRTLKVIGRNHTTRQIQTAFQLARKMGFSFINADLILGLPGETLVDVQYSLEELVKLDPVNITIHSLALKRASKWNREFKDLSVQQKLGEQMAQLAHRFLTDSGYRPYYLYRQRHILSNLENIGYAKPSNESIYNIQMMEERQTIIGLGGGAITKLVGSDYSLVRQANPKCPATYGNLVKDLISSKKYQIKRHLSV